MVPDFQVLSIVLFYSLFLISVVAALWKGGEPERWGVGVVVLAFVVQTTAYAVVPPRFIEVDGVALLVDLIALVGFGAIALNAKRIWPLFAASLQLISALSHFSRFVQIEVTGIAYSLVKSAPTGVVILLLLVGTILHQSRLKRRGYDPAWMDWEYIDDFKSPDRFFKK